jgi:predicted heme/steroid binding protein
MNKHPQAAPKKSLKQSLKKLPRRLRSAASRYPLVVFAVILGIGMVGVSLAFAHKANSATRSATGDFDTSRVLPNPVSMPAQSKTFTADSIKQYDGKDGHQCYVAVKGVVYEIKDNAYWKDGQHTPSDGRGYCGADMTNVISQSPHGESVLSSLPKVGVFK